MQKAVRLIAAGGQPLFLFDDTSIKLLPSWLLLVEDSCGDIWGVVTTKNPDVRRLRSIVQVYQVARQLGLSTLVVPVELRD